MATTVQNSKLTVRIVEEITVNSRKRDAVSKYEIRGINEIAERIVSVPTDTVTILSASSAVGAGTFLSSSLKYIRLTNLDDSNFIRLSFISGSTPSANTSDFKLEPQRNMIFSNTEFSGYSTSAPFDSFSSFTSLKGTADTSPVDLEIFIAST